MNCCPCCCPRLYPIWVKFRITDPHIRPLSLCEFHDNRLKEGLVLLTPAEGLHILVCRCAGVLVCHQPVWHTEHGEILGRVCGAVRGAPLAAMLEACIHISCAAPNVLPVIPTAMLAVRQLTGACAIYEINSKTTIRESCCCVVYIRLRKNVRYWTCQSDAVSCGWCLVDWRLWLCWDGDTVWTGCGLMPERCVGKQQVYNTPHSD